MQSQASHSVRGSSQFCVLMVFSLVTVVIRWERTLVAECGFSESFPNTITMSLLLEAQWHLPFSPGPWSSHPSNFSSFGYLFDNFCLSYFSRCFPLIISTHRINQIRRGSLMLWWNAPAHHSYCHLRPVYGDSSRGIPVRSLWICQDDTYIVSKFIYI